MPSGKHSISGSAFHGWSNTPTMLIHKWLTFDDQIALCYIEYASEGVDSLKKAVEDYVLFHVPKDGLTTDLLLWALQEANWPEVASALADT